MVYCILCTVTIYSRIAVASCCLSSFAQPMLLLYCRARGGQKPPKLQSSITYCCNWAC